MSGSKFDWHSTLCADFGISGGTPPPFLDGNAFFLHAGKKYEKLRNLLTTLTDELHSGIHGCRLGGL